MNPSTLLLVIFLIFAGTFALVFFLAWAFWAAPRRIQSAVTRRLGPRRIRAAVKTSFVYWLFVTLLAFAVAGLVGYLCWYYLAYWLYQGLDTWLTALAMKLNQMRWVWHPVVTDRGYDYRIVPFDLILCTLLGVFAGAVLGTWLGTLAASRRFLITRAMF